MDDTRLQRLVDLEKRMRLLGDGLRLLDEQWSAGAAAEGGLHPAAPRRAALLALRGVIDFIDADPDWAREQLSIPLYRLMLALKRVDDGSPVPWLIPEGGNGRPLSADERLALRGRCGAAMQWLMAPKDAERIGPREAGAAVVRGLGRDRIDCLREGKIKTVPNWRTVDRWRQDAAPPAVPGPARDGYDRLLAELRQRRGSPPTKAEAEADCRDILAAISQHIDMLRVG